MIFRTTSELTDIFPFTDEQVIRIARTEPTLRDMLQQLRHQFDHVVYGTEDERVIRPAEAKPMLPPKREETRPNRLGDDPPVHVEVTDGPGPAPSRLEDPNVAIKSVLVFESDAPPKIPLDDTPPPPIPLAQLPPVTFTPVGPMNGAPKARRLGPRRARGDVGAGMARRPPKAGARRRAHRCDTRTANRRWAPSSRFRTSTA